jgi:hypothetical protein
MVMAEENARGKFDGAVKNIEKQKRDKEKVQINNEVTRWALGYSHNTDVAVDSDDSLDDDYLDEIGTVFKTKEELAEARMKKKKKSKDQKLEVRNLMAELRRRSLANDNRAQAKSRFMTLISGGGEQPPPPPSHLNSQSVLMQESIMTFDDMSKDDDLSGDDLSSGYDSAKEKREKKGFKTNKMARRQPGIIQQNITVERVFLKDLLKLSRQRYIVKQGMEFQAKRFTEKQERKGLADPAILNGKRMVQTPDKR